MRRYQTWLTVGLLALTPGMTLAGPFSGLRKKAPEPAAAPQAAKPSANQEVAQRLKLALEKAKVSGPRIDIEFENGVARLDGMVYTPEQRQAATKAASSVKGVKKVANNLAVAEPPPRGQVQQAAARNARPQRARQVNQAQYEGQEPAQIPAEGAMPPQAAPQAPVAGPGYGPAPAAMYGAPMGGASHVMYNQPTQPDYAWPSYAQFPNYAAVTYPTQYSASAWPYIGPFYPYPQVPLGWRKATLEWDDGYWNLSFSPRTDRWWWFMDPKNW